MKTSSLKKEVGLWENTEALQVEGQIYTLNGNGKALKRLKRTMERRLIATWKHDDGETLKRAKGKALLVDEKALKGIGEALKGDKKAEKGNVKGWRMTERRWSATGVLKGIKRRQEIIKWRCEGVQKRQESIKEWCRCVKCCWESFYRVLKKR